MKLYAPKYYTRFKCIADKCTHSCCVGWEINIDEKTLDKYEKLVDGYGIEIKKSISKGEQYSAFSLTDEERCPHLDSLGLCRIITHYGDSYLCDICREHPRFYNYNLHGEEVGVGMACEEAARIILTSDDYAEFVLLGGYGEADNGAFDVISHRGNIYNIISNRSISYSDRLHILYNMYDISPAEMSDDEWREILSSLEYLDSKDKERFSVYSSRIAEEDEYAVYLERALAYFIYRHASSAADEVELREGLALAVFLERLYSSLIKSEKPESVERLALIGRTISEEIEYSEDNTESIKIEFAF